MRRNDALGLEMSQMDYQLTQESDLLEAYSQAVRGTGSHARYSMLDA